MDKHLERSYETVFQYDCIIHPSRGMVDGIDRIAEMDKLTYVIRQRLLLTFINIVFFVSSFPFTFFTLTVL